MTGETAGELPFQAHFELLQSFLAHRKQAVERIQDLLNAQRKPVHYLQDRGLLSRLFEDCLFTLPAVTDEQSRLRGRLEAARRDSGFGPRQVRGLHNDLVHPAEMMIRAFWCWQQTRWPGRNGRIRYAETLFNIYLIRCLGLLSLRVWDTGPGGTGDTGETSRAGSALSTGNRGSPGERLAQLQTVLDTLRSSSPADQPVLLRDARWLIPLAQSPTTDELGPYFEVARQVAEALPEDDRLEVQKAHVRVLGGHLTSQIRHYTLQDGVPFDDDSVVRRTRTSNALDFALLIQHLAGLLEAYERARLAGDRQTGLELAGAICQGISPDPELFLSRVDLLGAYSMIEHLFIAANREGRIAYTPMGRRHVELIRAYVARIGRMARPLYEDCARFRPVDGHFSPYGAIFGTPSHLLEHMALKTLQPDASTRFSLEDVFVDGDADAKAGADKLVWVNGWRDLPHIDREVQKLHAYPAEFAADIFERIELELRMAASGAGMHDDSRTGRLCLASADDSSADANAAPIPDLPVRYIGSSDSGLVAAGKAEYCDETRLLRDRLEGHFMLSYETSGGWVAIRKDALTEVLGAGRDAKIAGLPSDAARVLTLMSPDSLVSADLHESAG